MTDHTALIAALEGWTGDEAQARELSDAYLRATGWSCSPGTIYGGNYFWTKTEKDGTRIFYGEHDRPHPLKTIGAGAMVAELRGEVPPLPSFLSGEKR